MIQTLFGSLNEPEKKPGLLDRMRDAVSRTRAGIAERLDDIVALTRPLDEQAMEDLEASLIASDLGVHTASRIMEGLRLRMNRRQLEDGSQLKSALRDEIQDILDQVNRPPQSVNQPPEVIMLVGVNGTGKTTTAGKLATYLRAQGKSVILCAADTFRAAAIEQLEIWAKRSGVELIKSKPGGDPSAVLFDALTAARARKTDFVVVDTAGRLHTKSNLMAELEKMRRTAQRFSPSAPHETLLVLDATTGQNGLQQARNFTESAGVTGIVLTKLDGTAKGGIVVAIAEEFKLPVRYVGVGEAVGDLLPFDSKSFADSLLT
jgi:fused signal recognition particle receptor